SRPPGPRPTVIPGERAKSPPFRLEATKSARFMPQPRGTAMKVSKKNTRTSGAKAIAKAKPVHTPNAPKISAKAKPKSDKFGGTSKAPADKPAAQLPRSGWANTEDFKKAARASADLAG